MKSVFLTLVLGLAVVVGCTSISSLPQSTSEIDFGKPVSGQTGKWQFEHSVLLSGVDMSTALTAAENGMRRAGFSVTQVLPDEGIVFGIHGQTPYDAKIVAGVYLQPAGNHTRARAVARISKNMRDFSVTKSPIPQTASNWPQDILGEVLAYLEE